ncbi:hypothetical protein BJY52DRAFT_1417955 [Lactarius psammicola]|nr:hypothetical protein BJY52DRAFT_1417955 [Lactarius psammicola]
MVSSSDKQQMSPYLTLGVNLPDPHQARQPPNYTTQPWVTFEHLSQTPSLSTACMWASEVSAAVASGAVKKKDEFMGAVMSQSMLHLRAALATQVQRIPDRGGHSYNFTHHAEACVIASDHFRPPDPSGLRAAHRSFTTL